MEVEGSWLWSGAGDALRFASCRVGWGELAGPRSPGRSGIMIDPARATDPRAVALVDIDLRTEVFPATLLKTIEALAALPVGGQLEVTVSDPRSVAALPKAVREAGHMALEAVRIPDGFRIRVERGERAGS